MRIHWRSLAIDDLRHAREYISRDNPEAARAVVLRVISAVDQLAHSPGIGRPGRVPKTRELVVTDTPFIVPYRVRDNTVDVLRVYHQARRWPRRFD